MYVLLAMSMENIKNWLPEIWNPQVCQQKLGEIIYIRNASNDVNFGGDKGSIRWERNTTFGFFEGLFLLVAPRSNGTFCKPQMRFGESRLYTLLLRSIKRF
jgi:hypothetical protein